MTKNRFALTLGICALASFAQNAAAQDNYKNEPYTPFFIPVVYSVDNAWNQAPHDFTTPAAPAIISDGGSDLYVADKSVPEVDQEKKNFKSDDNDDFVDNLLEKIPYSKSLKYTWNVVDGDVDLYFEDLRVDRGNKGVTYKIDTLPMFGKMEGAELKADLGEDSKLTFKSDYMPMLGRVDGLQFKASAGTDDNTISLRYKTDISW